MKLMKKLRKKKTLWIIISFIAGISLVASSIAPAFIR